MQWQDGKKVLPPFGRECAQEGFDTWQIREERSIWTGMNAVVGVGRLGGRCRFALTKIVVVLLSSSELLS